MKEYTIDCLKWRCGDSNDSSSKNSLGKGYTGMINDDGFMCCLGQCGRQSGMGKEVLIGRASPAEVKIEEGSFDFEKFLARTDRWGASWGGGTMDSDFATEAMEINDNTETTPQEKISLLRNLFKENGLKIKFKNIKKALARKEKLGY